MSEMQFNFDISVRQLSGRNERLELARLPSARSTIDEEERMSSGNFASFVCLATYLEKKLRLESGSVFFDNENEVFGDQITLGRGASFRVQRAEWRRRSPTIQSNEEKRWGKYVALKSLVPKHNEQTVDWREVLLEVRTLLHEPLRYHPNIVRLIGFGWGPTGESSSVYPQLVLQFSQIGTMEALQMSNNPLPFPIKQKLCYDVGRGLSILHACGIVHGDLTHGNVLIYHSTTKTPGLPYTAKLSDFGGSVMDIAGKGSSLRMMTWPYSAPEHGRWLTPEGITLADVYSFGLFIWRTVLDGGSILESIGIDDKQTPVAEAEVQRLKDSNGLLDVAEGSIFLYSATNDLDQRVVDLVIYTIKHSIQLDPLRRNLPSVQYALRGTRLEEIPKFLQQVDEKNRKYDEELRNRAPGEKPLSNLKSAN